MCGWMDGAHGFTDTHLPQPRVLAYSRRCIPLGWPMITLLLLLLSTKRLLALLGLPFSLVGNVGLDLLSNYHYEVFRFAVVVIIASLFIFAITRSSSFSRVIRFLFLTTSAIN
jgi:hypothetical protein